MESTQNITINNREEQQRALFEFLQDGQKNNSPYYTLKATRKRAVLTGKLFKKAYEKESFIVWRNSFVPTEIFYALGITPFCAEGNCSMFANSSLSTKPLNIAEDNYYSRDTCSFLRCLIGTAILDCMPTPDYLVATTHYCDGAAKVFYNLSQKYNKPFYLIDIPYNYDKKEAVDYVAFQLEELVGKIEDYLNIKMDFNKLSECIQFSNEAREYFIKVHELRKNIPSPMLGGEAIDYVAMLSHAWGTKEAVEIYKSLYEELLIRVKDKIGAIPLEKYRILWRNLRPYYNNILSYLELQKNAVIVCEEVNYIHWEEMDIKDPYKGIARKLLSNPPMGAVQHWLDFTFNSLKEYKIDGIIEFAHWGCRHLNNSSQILKHNLSGTNIPFLIIDGDCLDSRNWSSGQIKTRIDAFIEILKDKKYR